MGYVGGEAALTRREDRQSSISSLSSKGSSVVAWEKKEVALEERKIARSLVGPKLRTSDTRRGKVEGMLSYSPVKSRVDDS